MLIKPKKVLRRNSCYDAIHYNTFLATKSNEELIWQNLYQLSKGLRRVSRGEKIRSKVCFRAKMCKKNTFSMGILLRLGFKPGFPISSDCFTCLYSKKWWVLLLYFEKWRSLDVPKETSLFNSKKIYYKTFWQSQTLVCTKLQVLLFILSF
jgi:hypothetical protein